MTNADVESSVASVDGQIMMVKYSDGEKKIVVLPDTPVVQFVPGNLDDLKPWRTHLSLSPGKKCQMESRRQRSMSAGTGSHPRCELSTRTTYLPAKCPLWV
jgi:hypothetical protein